MPLCMECTGPDILIHRLSDMPLQYVLSGGPRLLCVRARTLVEVSLVGVSTAVLPG